MKDLFTYCSGCNSLKVLINDTGKSKQKLIIAHCPLCYLKHITIVKKNFHTIIAVQCHNCYGHMELNK